MSQIDADGVKEKNRKNPFGSASLATSVADANCMSENSSELDLSDIQSSSAESKDDKPPLREKHVQGFLYNNTI